MQPTRWMLQVAGVLGLGLVVGLTSTRATADEGQQMFLKYCGSCHGTSGKGDGPVATSLKKKPADLTQIAKRHEGRFPMTEVLHTIDGTKTVRAHGAGDMPVWGEILAEGGPPGIEPRATASARLMALTKYVESIQQK